MSFQKELDAYLSKARKPIIEPKPRYEKVGRSQNTVRIYATKQDPRLFHIFVSFNIVQKLWSMRDPYSKDNLEYRRRPRPMYLQFIKFTDISIPAVVMRLEPYSFAPQGAKMYQPKGQRVYRASVTCDRIGVKPATCLRDGISDLVGLLGLCHSNRLRHGKC